MTKGSIQVAKEEFSSSSHVIPMHALTDPSYIYLPEFLLHSILMIFIFYAHQTYDCNDCKTYTHIKHLKFDVSRNEWNGMKIDWITS